MNTTSNTENKLNRQTIDQNFNALVEKINELFNTMSPELMPTYELKPIQSGLLFKMKLTIINSWYVSQIDDFRKSVFPFLASPWISVEGGKVLISMHLSETHIEK